MQEAINEQHKQAQYASLLGSIAKQSRWIFLGKIAFVLFGFAISILLARILGPSSLGRYQLGLTMIQVATIFSVAGFDRGLVRFLPIIQMKESQEGRTLVALNIKITLSLSIAFAIALYFAAPQLSAHYFHSDDMTKVLRMFSIYLPILSVSRIVSGAVVGLKRADLTSHITNIVSPVVFLILLLLIFFSGGDLVSSIFARSASHLLGAVILIFFLLKKLPGSVQTQERSVSLRRFLSFSTPLMLIGLIYFLLGQMDIIMLGYFVDEREVGIYSVAMKMAIFVIFGLEVVLPVVRPHFSELSERRDFETLNKLFKTATKWLFYSGLFVFSPLLILRFEILNIFGPEFVVGGSILLILGIGNLANVLSGPTGQMLVMTGKEKWEVANSFLIVVLNFLLNLFLIPRMGSIGAAIATALSIFAINTTKFIEVYLLYNIQPYSPKFLKGILAVFCGSVACYFVRWAALEKGIENILIIVLAGLSFAVVTFVSIWILGFDEEDKVLFEIMRSR